MARGTLESAVAVMCDECDAKRYFRLGSQMPTRAADFAYVAKRFRKAGWQTIFGRWVCSEKCARARGDRFVFLEPKCEVHP